MDRIGNKWNNDNDFNTVLKFRNETYLHEFCEFLTQPSILAWWTGSPLEWLGGIVAFPVDFPMDKQGYLTLANNVVRNKKVGVATLLTNSFYLGSYTYNNTHSNIDYTHYEPYTNCEIYMPFLGATNVPMYDIIGYTISFFLYVDYRTGQAVYYITRYNREPTFNSTDPVRIDATTVDDEYAENCVVISQNTFQLGYILPLGTTGASDAVRNVALSVTRGALAIAGSYVAGAAGANITTSTKFTTPTTVDYVMKERNMNTGRMIQTKSFNSVKQGGEEIRTVDRSNIAKGQRITNIFNTASDVISNLHLNPKYDNVNNSQTVSFCGGSIIIQFRKARFIPINNEFNHLYGKPLGEIRNLGDIKGYTEISTLHIEGDGFENATLNEKNMLDEIFEGGILFKENKTYTTRFYIDIYPSGGGGQVDSIYCEYVGNEKLRFIDCFDKIQFFDDRCTTIGNSLAYKYYDGVETRYYPIGIGVPTNFKPVSPYEFPVTDTHYVAWI